jgi:hypothetical protein
VEASEAGDHEQLQVVQIRMIEMDIWLQVEEFTDLAEADLGLDRLWLDRL